MDSEHLNSKAMPTKRDYGFRLIEDDELASMHSGPELAEGSTSGFSLWICELQSVLANIDWQTWLILGWFAALLTLAGISTIRYCAFVRRLATYQRVPNALVDAIAMRLIKSFGPSGLAWAGGRGPRFHATLPLTPRPPLPEDGERGRKKYWDRNQRCFGGRTFLGLRSVSVEVLRGPIGPAVVGFWKPRIVLPECIVATLNESELEALILHELIHVQRGDMLWSVAQMVIDAMWWFHPMWWYARRRMNLDMEISCDEETLARTSLAPLAYARCLLQVLEQKQHLLLAPNCPGVKPVEVTQERLESMMQVRQGCHCRSPFWLNLVFLAGCFLLVPSASIGLHGLENTTAENDSKAKIATSDENPEVLSKEYDVAALLERLCKETKIEKEQAAEDLAFRLSEQPRVFSFNLPATSTAEAPPSIGARSTENQIPSDSTLKIKNGTLHASGSAEFHTQLQDKIDRYSKTGFASIVAEIVVIRSMNGYSIGVEGDNVISVDAKQGIIAFDTSLADRVVADLKKSTHSEIVACPKVLFQSGTSFDVSTEFEQGKPIKKLECHGNVTLLDSGLFDVDFEVELSAYKTDSDAQETDEAMLPPPREIRTISTRYTLPSGKTLYLRHLGAKNSTTSSFMVFVKCYVPEVQPAGVKQAVSTNNTSSNDHSSIQLASATQAALAKPIDSQLPSIAIQALPTSRYWQSPDSSTFSQHFTPGSLIAQGLSRITQRQGTKDFRTLTEHLLTLGYSAHITGDVSFQIPASPLDSHDVEIAGKRLKISMQKGEMLQCGFGRFTLNPVSSNNPNLDFDRFSTADFDGYVIWANRVGSVVARRIKIDNKLVTLEGDVSIVDRDRFTAKADRVLFDGETYTFGCGGFRNASLSLNDSTNAPKIVQAQTIQFNVNTEEIQTDRAPQPE